MKRIVVLSALWALVSYAFAQPLKTSYAATDSAFVCEYYHENAQFPGGDKACQKWIQEHIKYPEGYTSNQPQGRVVVSFSVEKDGSIDSVKVFRSPDPLLSEEAIRVVKQMPKWKPARYKGEVIRTRYFLPIIFKQP